MHAEERSPKVVPVDVWLRRVADVGPAPELLDEHERRVLAGLVTHAAARSYAAGHVLLRRAVSEAVGVSPTALRFDRTCSVCGAQHGRPVLLDDPALHLSLSHASEAIAVAVSHTAPVGVDIETHAAVDFEAFAESALHEEELERVEDGPAGGLAGGLEGRLARRATAWVRKEATLKALGVGLRLDATRFPAPPTGARVCVADLGEVVVVDLPVPWPGLSAALAVSGPFDVIEVRAR
ncbi:4-phosphopantetheinyl transferase [Intrasporangium oryzae NRRL B-24470]|uniref:4-phosphopantetheinyl transferase n=1 Tax=Intrasporangium oryzae NRRL B-24470 TaxID=1386089 RepID=W9G6A9_9MICO|nr:4'-phosphopantetheinyl transferase superfamily protein [Intrasporangium oryzae]EWT00343.1 4-phosphopantetheinyl transferase [Intrasporangium oryzae NRRL B-24470]